MELISEILINDIITKFYKGFDYNTMLNHPKDGSNGFMIVFIDKWSDIIFRLNRSNKIDRILKNVDRIDFKNFKFDNNYMIIYQTQGEFKAVYESIKERMQKINFNLNNPKSLYMPWGYNI